MSYFDDASLVMIPSGYKDQKVYSVKPIDGSGDLTFSRASSATRVNSSLLVEKVRTNLFTYSEQLDNAAWTKAVTTITANAIVAPDGTTTADKMADSDTTTAARYTYQPPASSGTIYTSSGYFKKGEYNFVTLHAFGINGAVFNLDTGVKVSQSGGVGSIESVGNGWYRCSFAFTAGGGSVFFSQSPAGNISYAGTTGSGIYAWGLQVETGDIATDYIATTSSAVSVGPVSGLPRLDYSGGASCPSLLLEPQTTALNTNSEVLSNWTQVRATISSNAITSPDGYQNADGIVASTANDDHFISQNIAVTAIPYTFSAFVKKGSKNWVRLWETSTNVSVDFNLETGATGTTVGSVTSKGTQDYGNGWLRCYITYTATAGTNAFRVYAMEADNDKTFIGDGSTVDIYVWGINLTATSYLQSYIPTLSTAVTRVADTASKTGISSLIGQTEGTLFVEFDFNGNYDANGIVAIDILGAGGNEAYIFITGGGQLRLELYVASVIQGLITTSIGAVGRKKIAFAYKANDFVGYMNGVQIGTDTSGTVGAMDTVYVGTYQSATYAAGNMNQTLLFKTRLSNTDRATLTTI